MKCVFKNENIPCTIWPYACEMWSEILPHWLAAQYISARTIRIARTSQYTIQKKIPSLKKKIKSEKQLYFRFAGQATTPNGSRKTCVQRYCAVFECIDGFSCNLCLKIHCDYVYAQKYT